MGQYFIILNIDRDYRLRRLGKFGEIYLDSPLSVGNLGNPNHCKGDRLILLGNCANDFPAGIKRLGESKRPFQYEGPGRFHDGNDHSSCSATSVLCNLCSREYIKAELFPGHGSHPGLGEVILPKIVWTSEANFAHPAEIAPRGLWAGARFDIVEFDVVKDDPNWKDITELEFFNYYSLWNIDTLDWELPHTCDCKLCTKYKEEVDEFYSKQDSKNTLEASRPIMVCKTPVLPHNPAPISRPFDSRGSSAIETLPNELHGEIVSFLIEGDLATCAAVSKTLSLQATRKLYSCVRLKNSEQTDVLLETITRHPELTGYIRHIRIVTLAHWESLQVAHDILKQLPLLNSLEFAPCWFSYGDLPCHEYPFALRQLSWGLREDDAFKRFCRHHSNAQITITDPVLDSWVFGVQEYEEDP